jgi:hypothetical protein
VDRAEALRALPDTYAIALRLCDEGAEPDTVARVLNVEPEAVRPLLTLADAKLASLIEHAEEDSSMSRHNPSVAPEDGYEREAKAPPGRERKGDRTSLAVESVKKAQERFKNFSLSKFSVDAMPPNYVPHKRELPVAERVAHVQEFQRKKIERQLRKRGKVDSPNRGFKLALPTDAVDELLPGYRAGTVELSDLMDLVSRHMRGTEFFNRGNPTLTRMTLQARVSEALGLDGEENPR